MPVDRAAELEEIRASILAMGSEVEHRLKTVVAAVSLNDPQPLRDVMLGDDAIDAMEVSIEHQGLRILALTQPVASDLRRVLVAMRISGHLEQIGDQVSGVAKRALDLHELDVKAGITERTLPESLVSMAKVALDMLQSANQALTNESIGTAAHVRRSKDRINALQREVFVWATQEKPDHSEHTVLAIDALSIARKLDSIGGLSACIAEEIVFLVEGTVIRHT